MPEPLAVNQWVYHKKFWIQGKIMTIKDNTVIVRLNEDMPWQEWDKSLVEPVMDLYKRVEEEKKKKKH